MQALDIANAVFRREVGRTLATIFGTTPDAYVLLEALRTGVQHAARETEWRQLVKSHTITGNGVTEAWPLPSDFRGLITGGDLRETDSKYSLRFVPSRQEWLGLVDLPAPQGARWTFDGSNILINPALDTGTTVELAYISTANWSSGSEYPASDVDNCVLPSEVTIAAAVLYWRQFQGMDTERAERAFRSVLASAIRNDTGGPILTRASVEDSAYDFTF